MKKVARPAKGNDQAPKPLLGNSKHIHGITSVDNAGGHGPDPVNPGKASKKGK